MTQMLFVDLEPDGASTLRASCSLDDDAMPARLAEWLALRQRGSGFRQTDGGAVLVLADDESLPQLDDLINRESQCCAFYRFTIRVAGDTRELQVDAGPGGYPAVAALLSLD
jgi:hypothetical protein